MAMTSAQADVFEDLGVHTAPFLFKSETVATGAFADIFVFTVPVGFNLLGSVVVSDDDAPDFSITDGAYALASAGIDGVFNTSDDSLSAIFSFDATTGSAFNAAGGGAGLYAYAIFGTGVGTEGGRYALTSFIEADSATVPEPETFALALLGLAGIGAFTRRRAS
ncbi:MAG: FxDxF family PEP-CTERM protein [Burkholderiaceae bacterium]|nr:FxDxF family PEP-CTERM protein [Burkholderiaceae bacterium]